MMEGKFWFILELETGLIDGWYMDLNDNPETMRKYWDETRPGFTHIAAVAVSDGGYLPDTRSLSRAKSGEHDEQL